MPSRFLRGIRITGLKMGKTRGRIAALMCAGVLMTATAMPALCAENIHSQLAAKKAEQVETAKKAQALETEMGGLKTRLIDAGKSMRDLESSLANGDNELKVLAEKKELYIRKIYQDNEKVGGLVTAARKYKSTSTPQMLAQSRPIDAARASLVMKSVIPTLNHRSARLKQELAQLEQIENEIGTQLAIKKIKLSELNTKKTNIDALLEERRDIYKQTEQERKQQEDAVAKLAKEAKNLDELVRKIKPKTPDKSLDEPRVAASTYRLPADTILPVQGKIMTGFAETDELGAKSEGVTFITRSEATVVTPLSGKVKFAGAFQKYKQILIIEHQGGYHSLIAGLGRIDTVVGAVLSGGEPVGISEKSSDNSSRIYYELRLQGEPVNPQKLKLSQRKQVKS